MIDLLSPHAAVTTFRYNFVALLVFTDSNYAVKVFLISYLTSILSLLRFAVTVDV